MKEKVLLKKVMAEKMPDFEIKRHMILEHSALPRRKKVMPNYRLAAGGVIFCFLIIFSFSMFTKLQLDEASSSPEKFSVHKKAVIAEETGNLPKSSDKQEADKQRLIALPEMALESKAMGEIVINEFEKKAELKINAKAMSLPEEHEEVKKLEDMVFKHLILPAGIDRKHFEKIFTPDKKTKEFTVFHDYWINYSQSKGDKTIEFKLSKDFEPLRDYSIKAETKISHIGETEVVILYGPEKWHIAYFRLGEFNYDLETFGLSREEFLTLLSSVLKQ